MAQSTVFGPHDQAAGLRRWAEQQGRVAEPRQAVTERPPEPPADALPAPAAAAQPCPLIVVGLSGDGDARTEKVRSALGRLGSGGHAWVGEVSRWRIYDLPADSPRIGVLGREKIRWALWVDDGLDSFRRAYGVLKQVREGGGPQTLLVLHPGIGSRDGLLNNLKWSAIAYLGVELILLDEKMETGQ